MTDIAGRPGTWLQQSGEDSLAPAIERALAEPRMTDREQRALLLQTSWRHRRAELREAIARMRGRRQGANKRARAALRERSDLQPEDCALRVTWTGTAECNMQPVCPYCSTRWTRAERPAALPRTPQAIVGALMRLTAARGPLYISLCYGDPLSSDDSAWIIGQLARYNRVDVVSNILFPIERLRSLVPANGNVAFATSFHPHAWGGDVERFIAKRREIDGAGFRCGMTEIVGYPPYLSRLAEWRETLAGAGVTSSALPFCGQYAGKTYPDEYTDSHWSIVLGAMRDVYGTEHSELARRTSPAGRMCRCGRDYIWIDWDGTMWRCSMPQDGGRLGNLFGDYELLTVPAVCTAMACPCPDLWRYVEG